MNTRIISTTLAIILLTISCKNNKVKPEDNIDLSTTSTANNISEMKLQDELNTLKNKFEATAPEDKKQKYKEGLEGVKNSGVLDKAINVGDKAPNFTLKNALNKSVTLYDELKKGPVVLIWYRGGWCPYCNLTLHALQENLPAFEKENATLIALTPEVPDKSLSTSEKHELKFNVLSDLGNKIGKEYGIVFKLTNDVADIYQTSFDLHGFNGDESNELPLGATYIINKEGIVTYAFLDPDYRNRAEPATIIENLKKLK